MQESRLFRIVETKNHFYPINSPKLIQCYAFNSYIPINPLWLIKLSTLQNQASKVVAGDNSLYYLQCWAP